jgi:hypothetical protein
MDTKTLMWIISGLLTVIAFFVIDVWRDVRAMKKDIKDRTLIMNCKEKHAEVDRYLHQHGSLGQAGEVIEK